MSNEVKNEEPSLGCRDGCGARVRDELEASAKGWECLQITGLWRCVDCSRKLRAVNQSKDDDGQPA